MRKTVQLVVLSHLAHVPGRYVVADAETGEVLLGPFHSVPDAARLSQALADQQRTTVIHKTLDWSGREVGRSRIFFPRATAPRI